MQGRVALLVALASGAACTVGDADDVLVGDADEPTVAGDDASEEEPGGTVLSAPFEAASADCNGWAATGAVAIRSVPPRSGAYACKLCATDAGTVSLASDVDGLSAGSYRLGAWVRRRPATAAPSHAILRTEREGEARTHAETALVDAWSLLESTFDIQTGAASVRIAVVAPAAAANDCFLVDDVVLERAR